VILSITSRVSPDDWLTYLSPVSAYGSMMGRLVIRPDDTSLAGWVVSMAMHSFAVYVLYIGAIRCYSARVSTTIRRGSGN
jgi:hypothetical protein